MRATAFGLVGRLCRDNLGALLLKLTIAFLPLLSVATVAMDLSQVIVVKQKLTNAVDAAALAVGRQLGRDDVDILALAQGFSNAHDTPTDVGDLTNLARSEHRHAGGDSARRHSVPIRPHNTIVDCQYRAWSQSATACELNSV